VQDVGGREVCVRPRAGGCVGTPSEGAGRRISDSLRNARTNSRTHVLPHSPAIRKEHA